MVVCTRSQSLFVTFKAKLNLLLKKHLQRRVLREREREPRIRRRRDEDDEDEYCEVSVELPAEGCEWEDG